MEHKDNYLVPQISPRTVRKQSRNLKHTVPKSWNGSHGHSRPHTTQAIWIKPSRRKPLPLGGFVKTSQLRSLCQSLAMRMNSSYCSAETASPIVRKFREKVESLSLSNSLFFFLFLFYPFLFSHPTVWSKMGQELVLSLATCPIFIGS